MRSRLSLPASIFEKSRMSLINASRDSPDLRTMVRYSRCSSVSGVSSASSVMPMMAFIGVRISWLMFARKPLLARLAASAASLAFCNSSSERFRSVMSTRVPWWRIMRPEESQMALELSMHTIGLPSFLRSTTSRVSGEERWPWPHSGKGVCGA